MTCKMCSKRRKTWKGSDPICYFDNPSGNWNCATVGAIRNLVFTGGMFESGREELPYGINKQHFDDMNYATILITPVRVGGTSKALVPTGGVDRLLFIS